MKKYKKRFKEGMNFALSINLCRILKNDAEVFGYIKNKQTNISGFLNDLIPSLSSYREDLHQKFLDYNDNDNNISLLVEENIYNVYLKIFDINDDGLINIPFRINNKHKEDFIYIHDNLLDKYNTDFTNYVRSLLNEYCSKQYFQREQLFFYEEIEQIKESIELRKMIKIYSDDEEIMLLPIFIDTFDGDNYVCGIDESKEKVYAIEIKDAKEFSFLDKEIQLTDEEEKNAYHEINKLFNEEGE